MVRLGVYTISRQTHVSLFPFLKKWGVLSLPEDHTDSPQKDLHSLQAQGCRIWCAREANYWRHNNLRRDWLINIAFYTLIYHIYISYIYMIYIYDIYIYMIYMYIYIIYDIYNNNIYIYIILSYYIYTHIYISYINIYDIYFMYHYISFLWNCRTLPLVWLDHWRTWILCIFLPCHGWPRMCLVERCMMPWGKKNTCAVWNDTNCIWEQRARFHFASCR